MIERANRGGGASMNVSRPPCRQRKRWRKLQTKRKSKREREEGREREADRGEKKSLYCSWHISGFFRAFAASHGREQARVVSSENIFYPTVTPTSSALVGIKYLVANNSIATTATTRFSITRIAPWCTFETRVDDLSNGIRPIFPIGRFMRSRWHWFRIDARNGVKRDRIEDDSNPCSRMGFRRTRVCIGGAIVGVIILAVFFFRFTASPHKGSWLRAFTTSGGVSQWTLLVRAIKKRTTVWSRHTRSYISLARGKRTALTGSEPLQVLSAYMVTACNACNR